MTVLDGLIMQTCAVILLVAILVIYVRISMKNQQRWINKRMEDQSENVREVFKEAVEDNINMLKLRKKFVEEQQDPHERTN